MASKPTDDDLIFQGFFMGARLALLVGGHPQLNDNGLVALVRSLRRVEAGDETTIDSEAELSKGKPRSREREASSRENRQIEREVARIVLDGFPPHIRDLA